MARRPITQELYDLLVDAWRANPGHQAKAAKYAGVDPRTAQKAWDSGFPAYGFEPISVLMEREQYKARAAMMAEAAAKAALAEKEREEAVKQAIQARAQEGQLVALSRGKALGAMAASSQLSMAARQLAGYVKAEVEKAMQANAAGQPSGLSLEKAMRLLQQSAAIMADVNDLAHETMVMERLHLGEPGQIVGVLEKGTDISMDEAEIRLQSAQEAIERAKSLGGLRVIDGGLAEPSIGRRVAV